jgi:hypothetical protein
MRWRLTWLLAIAAVLLAGALFERSMRQHGYVPSVQDDADLWAIQADRLWTDDSAIALLGASRIQFAVDPKRVEAATGHATAMLAINGQYPLAALRWLANDTPFRGLVIMGIDARGLSGPVWNMQQPWIDHYRKRWTLARKFNRDMLTPLQEHLVIARSPFAAVNLVRRDWAGFGLPFNDYVVMRPDRLGELDYRRTDIAAIRARRIADIHQYYLEHPPEPAAQWLAALDEVSGWVRTIQARGGQVVFLREPSADEHLAADERAYPRADYWDVYAKRSPAMLIDFRDAPAFGAITLPDTSHIDGTQIAAFTEALLATLRERGIIGHLRKDRP